MDGLRKNQLTTLVLLFVFVFCNSLVFIQPVLALNNIYDREFYMSNHIQFYNPEDICASSGGSTTQLFGSNNRQKIWNYLIARGLSPEQTAGVMGNIQSESAGSWNPMVNEYSQKFGEGGFGIVQWTGGRRDNIVDYLTTGNSALMDKYYNANYSSSSSATTTTEGFIARNSQSGELMPVEDNDKLLLAELDFLYDESNNRSIHSNIVNMGLGETGDKEWDALKRQTTIEGASNLWVYSFEIPRDIEATAVIRAQNGQTIYDVYSISGSGDACTSDLSKQELAKKIIASPNLSFMAGSNSARQKQLIQDIANGTNDGNAFPCGANILILKMIAAILDANHTLRINDLNRACTDSTAGGLSSTSSRHYNGNGSAIDLGLIDDLSAFSQDGADLIVSIIKPYLLENSSIAQLHDNRGGNSGLPSANRSACLLNLDIPSSTRRFDDGCNHLHIDVAPNSDPALKCKTPVYFGGCDPSQQV
jgi:hypothetical protein